MKKIVPEATAATAGLGSLAAAFAGLCCVGPLALAVLGVEGVIAAAVLEPYRWPILAVSLLLLVAAFAVARVGRGRGGTTAGDAASCRMDSRRRIHRLLRVAGGIWVLALVIALIGGVV